MPEIHAFIGSDKNAGKTTALLYEYQKFRLQGKQIVLTGIGINGESIDAYDGHSKPTILAHTNTYVITNPESANLLGPLIEIVKHLLPPRYSRPLVLIKMLAPAEILIQGPNEKWEFQHLKEDVNSILPHSLILLDGSIDRQFLGHSDICDYLYYCLYSSHRIPQRNKAKSQMRSLLLPLYNRSLPPIPKGSNWCGWDVKNQLLGFSDNPAFLDPDLQILLSQRPSPLHLLWLGGALTSKLAERLCAIPKLNVILEDHTLWQNVSTGKVKIPQHIWLRQKPALKKIYLREEIAWDDVLPSGCQIQNLYREATP